MRKILFLLVLIGFITSLAVLIVVRNNSPRYIFAGSSISSGQQEVLVKVFQHDPFTRQLAKLILKTEGKILRVDTTAIDGFVSQKKFLSKHGTIDYMVIEGRVPTQSNPIQPNPTQSYSDGSWL